MRGFTLGSLFDGSGGFPLAGAMHGIRPVWASEIEPFPIRVTKLRFPQMKHLGSVTDINGAEIEPVDIITFGSPCQDLSVAGQRKGIHEGERSNLFFEAVRVIKEMREHDRSVGRANLDLRPRFAVWENVPGAFSSNNGEDFRAVLQAFCDIMEDGLHIPRPKKWNHAGCVAGNGWSLAWRVYDAQYWPGTPQRRKRIYLVADFASERAGEILFERESVPGDTQPGGKAREGTAADAERGSCGCGDDLYNGCITGCVSKTLSSSATDSDHVPVYIECIDKAKCSCFQNTGRGWWNESDYAATIRTPSGGGGDGAINANVVCVVDSSGNGKSSPLDAHYYLGAGNRGGVEREFVAIKSEKQARRKYILRRLTPTECARLQGFPDWWCDGADGSDTAQYKMWGNGIALPCAADVIGRVKKALEEAKV